MKTVNISDDQHNELFFLANKYSISIKKLLSTVVKIGIGKIPGHIGTDDQERFDVLIFTDAISSFDRPVPLHLIHRHINKKDIVTMTLTQCAEVLFLMILEGSVEMDENMLYSMATKTPKEPDLI